MLFSEPKTLKDEELFCKDVLKRDFFASYIVWLKIIDN